MTVGEGWEAMADRLDGVAVPELVVLDGEDAITNLADRLLARHPGAALLVAPALFQHPAWTDLTHHLRPTNTIGFDLCAA